MGLILPHGPSWAYCSSNLDAVTALSAPGTALTPGGSDAKGSTVEVLAALAHDVEFLRIGLQGFSTDSQDGAALMDVMYDPAGGTSWQVLIPDLCIGYTGGEGTGNPPSGLPRWYEFPIWIPAGSSVGVRAQSHLSSPGAGYVAMVAYGGNRHPASWWCGQYVTALGINASTSRGAPVTPGSASWGTWTNVGSTVPADCGAVCLAVHGQFDAIFGMVAAFYLWQFSADGQQIGPTLLQQNISNEICITLPQSNLIFANLPAGTQFQARGNRVAGGMPLEFDVAVYVVH